MAPLYERVARAVLPGWEVSLAFVSPAVARGINKKLRGKTYTPNVLSYQVGERSGEIIICREEAAKQAPNFRLSTSRFILFLFIHGLLHLEGRRHGTTMERREQALLEEFGARPHTHGSTHRNRHRHRDLPGQDSRRRGDPR